MSRLPKYKQEVCEGCGQTTTRSYSLDRKSAGMILKMAELIKQKKINSVHLRDELGAKGESCQQVLRTHGLIVPTATTTLGQGMIDDALANGKPISLNGNWSLTSKGLDFVTGFVVPRRVIVDHHGNFMCYWGLEGEGKYSHTTIKALLKEPELYSEDNYKIDKGIVV